MKVVQLVADLNRGGLEKIVSTIVHKLNSQQYEIEIWCIARGGIIADELTNDGFVVKILGITSYLNPLNVFKLAIQLRKSKAKIVHMHGFFCNTIGAISCALASVPIRIVHLHTTLNVFTPRDVLRTKITNYFVDKVIFVSNAAYESSVKVGCGNPTKSVTIYNGIDTDGVIKQPASAQKNILTIVASLNKHKGHTYLLDAVNHLRQKNPDVNLWIIGKGPLRESLEQKAKNLGIEQNVTFWGEQKDVPGLLSQSKIFVLASLREGLPLSIMEAMIQERPVVAHRIGGVPEIVEDGATGYLVEPENSKQFAEKIALLLSDPKKQDQMGKEARLVFEQKFSSKIMMGQIEQIYSDLIQSKLRLQ